MEMWTKWFEEVWNKGSEEAIDEMLTPDVVVHGLKDPQGNPIENIQQFKAFFRVFRRAISGMRIEVEQTITEGNLSVARFVARGTHTGEGMGIAPQGGDLNFTGMVMARMENGKFAECWNNVDFMTMVQQMQPKP